jgi:hypothetical protein
MHLFERLFHFEHLHEPVASHQEFGERLRYNALVAGALLLFSLALGMAGYKYFVGGLGWVDAFYRASMLLSGMGPVGDPPDRWIGKLFAGLYALYAGAIFLLAAAVVVAPLLHRVMHHFHLKTEEREAVEDHRSPSA